MKILIENPPEWIMQGCLSKFRVDHKYTVWTYGDTLYNPGGTELPEHILVHESHHSIQQRDYFETRVLKTPSVGKSTDLPQVQERHGKDAWWERFLADPEFRVSQEAEAYGAQYRYICSQYKDRNERNRWLVHLTNQLSGPLYQSSIKSNDARAIILKHAKV